MNSYLKIEHLQAPVLLPDINEPYYFIVLFDGAASFSIDFNNYECKGRNILFISPFQLLKWQSNNAPVISLLRFHGDFYCIEYHKEEVACNGILFNNIYEKPFFSVSNLVYDEIVEVFRKIEQIENLTKAYNISIVKSYLQLILALSSREKHKEAKPRTANNKSDVQNFKSLLDQHFLETKSVTFYAEHYGLSVDAFSRKIKKYFGKTPSKLIQERLALEAKRLLHLTYKSIKEIANYLGFEDEFYFSRYFKKEVGVSPKVFRKKVGISVVAKLSM